MRIRESSAKNAPERNDAPLVVAVIATDLWPGRAELRGFSEEARRRGWTLEEIDFVHVGRTLEPYRELLARADGIVVRLNDALTGGIGVFAELEAPIVGLDTGFYMGNGLRKPMPGVLWARVLCDQSQVATAAADELLATGRRHFVFVPMLRRYPWTGTRGEAFLERIRAADCEAHLYEPVTDWAWVKERENLARWLAGIPRPFGIFAGNDLLAKLTLDACRTAGIEVPQDAAIVGADDDETFCLTASPTLTSVRIDFEGAGRLAAETLATLFLKRRPARSRIVRYGVLGVARRDSTRTVEKGTDLRLAAGLDFIAAHAADPFVGARDVAAAMGLGRRQADRMFAATGATIRGSIEETRLAAARRMLQSSDAPVSAIAARCGFASSNYFIRIFHARTGLSPDAWRRQSRGEAANPRIRDGGDAS